MRLQVGPFVDMIESVKVDKRIKNYALDEAQLNVLREQSHAILNDLIFRNGLKLAAGNNMGMRKICLGLYADVEKLIVFIDEELGVQ